MGALIYSLCALTSITCLVLLWRSWRASGARLLFWSALCFAALSVNNVLLVIDRVILPVEVNLYTWRLGAAFIAVLLLLFGLIWEED
ncbi:hypothetical protein HK414_12270 [Ramlibacter terrae]|uniref:Histidine kinase N-terminal 7TM region domain-containing protein n=1 Tax=Ramlibacter terrae TaxID=2732511 RepID=A0ABX6P2G8_9BURK|nr:hypothetical protein HK414_12270 [Ramlibacter terrae]